MLEHTRRGIARRTLGAGIAVSLLVPALANAQAIGGTVSDTTGGVLPGVTVEARSPSLIEQVRTGVTDGNGQYLIVALEPGAYTVTYSLSGFNTLVREGVVLNTGFTASIDVQLSVGDIQETVTVTGASPVVDIQNVERREVMDRAIIDSIPTGKTYQNYTLLVPGMGRSALFSSPLDQDQGGMSPANSQHMSIHGGTGNDQQLTINGMEFTDPLSQGGSFANLPDSNFEELSISTSSQRAEVETGGVRVNMIPREGGNQFSGHVFTTFSFPELQADNIDDDLRGRGLSTGTFVDKLWTISPVVGGPIVRDRLWFFLTHTSGRSNLIPADVFHAVDPAAFVYVPNSDDPSLDVTKSYEQSVNFTWQVSARDKLKLYWTNSSHDRPFNLQGRTFPTIFVSPEAATASLWRTNIYQATWTRPQTNRLLFEAGFSHVPTSPKFLPTEGSAPTIPGILEFSPVTATRNMSSWFSGVTQRASPRENNYVRAAVSYVTGSHNLKVGMTGQFLRDSAFNHSAANWTDLGTFRGFPLRANFRTPGTAVNNVRAFGFYAQEQWTLDRLTVNAGLRFDNFWSGFPDQTARASTWAPQDFFYEGQTATSWQDLQPRLGVAYDLRGDGRTALKFSASRAGQMDSSDWAIALNPGQTNRLQTRTWNDGLTGCVDTSCIPGDGLPQGDPLNPSPNGELLNPNTNLAFGQPVVNTFFDENWSTGWGNRHSNWEITAGVQQELVSGVSLDVSYFRRIFVSFPADDDRNVGPDDFDRFQVAIPDDPRLPNAGQMITLVDRRPEASRSPNRIFTSADHFGGESRTWQGLDITADARVQDVLFQGGLSTGAFSTDNCAQLTALPENLPNTRGSAVRAPIDYCETSQNWLTQVKFLTSYTLPYDIQVAATLQNQEGPERIANVTYRSAAIGAVLGRPSIIGNQTVNVLEPGSMFGERFTQFDLRFTKIVGLGGGTQLRAMLDIFNLFNSNSVTREQVAFGANWLAPQVIMAGRLAKFAFQLDF